MIVDGKSATFFPVSATYDYLRKSGTQVEFSTEGFIERITLVRDMPDALGWDALNCRYGSTRSITMREKKR